MFNPCQSLLKWMALSLLVLVPLSAHALTLAQEPLFLIGSVKPQVMLDISKDQQLYKRAYNDYSDLDNDGQFETTYKHGIDYYGYFDSYKCYEYSGGLYVPVSVTTNKYCSGQWSGNFLNWATMTRMDAVRKLLYGGTRSTDGATTTVLERVYLPTDAHSWAKYYKGSDIAQLTPYNPPIAPTAINTSDSSNSAGVGTGLKKFRMGSNTTSFSVGDQVVIRDHATPDNYMIGAVSCVKGSGINMYNGIAANANSCSSSDNEIGVVVERTGGTTGGTNKDWDIYNHTQTGITICNTTLGPTVSQSNTNPPLMRVAQGNFGLWAANERWQCLWRDETSSPGESTNSGGTRTNGNRAAITNLYASSLGPNQSSSAGKINNAPSGYGDFNLRVQACVPGLIGKEKCKTYPGADGVSGNADDTYKPIGLLQVYGDPDQIHFGLMTGSYKRNISGGVLRKNVGSFTDEVNTNTDGTFTATVGIIKTLDRMRLYGYSYTDGGYYNTADSCAWQLTSITEGSCSTWGNPMSEMYFESLRYFSGQSVYYNYTNSGSKDAALGLPQPAWVAPLSNANYCAPLNILAFNASVSTNDFDLAGTSMSAINSGSTAAALANLVGTGEGIAGGNYFVGANGSINNELCSAKTVGNLGSIYGICPEGPTLLGSYLMPGMAYHARTQRIRTDLTRPDGTAIPATDTKSLKVATYGVQLATNVPQVRVALLGETQPRVIIQPAYRLFNTAPQGGGALVDMKIVNQTATSDTASGQIYINWEDSEQGGDYDQDVWGVLTYCLTTVTDGCGTGTVANRVYVTTKIIAESTNKPQGFGYIVSGTTQDGPHFHSGIGDTSTTGFDFTDTTNISVTGGSGHINASGGCNNCQLADTATTATYTLGSNSASALKDPLYYAAKWGGFNDIDNDGKPSSTLEWDILKADGTPGSDGIPDNYFLVSNPLGLEIALNSAFLKILKDSSASAVATNSSSLNTGSRIYQGRFSSSSWSGQLLSYRLGTDGSVLSAASPPPNWDPSESPYPDWDAGQKINAQLPGDRVILTTGATGSGTGFAYGNLNSGQQDALNDDAYSNQDNCGPERVAYLRGDKVNEGSGTFTCASTNTIFKFRARDISVLGDVVNSNPVFVGAPAAGYADADHPGYSAFQQSYKHRKAVVYVGANDGMLHGFEALVWDPNVDTDSSVDSDGDGDKTNDANGDYVTTANSGNELLAYVPSMVYGNLSRLTDSNYIANGSHRYFVDSSPMVADVCTANCTMVATAVWKSLLVSGLGAGGKGFFALDVTNPETAFNELNASNVVQWEFKSDADLGFTYNNSPSKLSNNQAKQIAKFENDRWGVVLGNGYNSANGKAVLYVLFVNGPTGSGGAWQAGGVDYVKIVADVGTNNGLSTPVPFDSDGDGLVDTVYAGDLKGNMWKFDLSDSSAANWTSASLLFSALDGSGNPQPIINSPEVTLHPTSGNMVLFGTGKFLETGDTTAPFQVQTFYGVQDTGATVGGRGALIPQTISTVAVSGVDFRTVTTGCGGASLPVCTASPKGWYADLPTTGERATGTPKLVAGNIYFNTFIPSTSACEFGGTGWLMAMNYLTGALPVPGLFDTNNDGKINDLDTAVSGAQIGAALGGTTLIKGSGTSTTGVGVSSTTEGTTPTTLINFGAGSRGRITWREIVQ
jgi:type IV pilus assembly protein PilY1